jgi:hypothetical protein
VFLGYRSFFSKETPINLSSQDTNIIVDQDFTNYINKLKQVQIDTKLFESTVWKNLKDFSISVPEITPGNTNLFKIQTAQTTPIQQNHRIPVRNSKIKYF